MWVSRPAPGTDRQQGERGEQNPDVRHKLQALATSRRLAPPGDAESRPQRAGASACRVCIGFSQLADYRDSSQLAGGPGIAGKNAVKLRQIFAEPPYGDAWNIPGSTLG